MFCINCGTQLPEEANFCWKCGRSQKPGVQTEEPKWETCEIEPEQENAGLLRTMFSLQTDRYNYVAKAVGPKGIYMVAETGFVDNHEKAVQTLVSQLVQQGWESMGKGERWYSYKFRRRVQ